MEPYGVAAVQHVIRRPVFTPQMHQENLERSLALIEYAAARPDRPQLVLCPDWHPLSGLDTADLSELRQSAFQVPGPETDRLAVLAQRFGIYIGGACLEQDSEWPDHVFKTAFLIAPDGSLALKYRSHNGSMQQGIAAYTCPADVYDQYVERYGFEAMFPTVATPLGKIGMLVGDDANFPEVSRHLALSGAELLLHVGGEPLWAGARESWSFCRRTRAYENVAYVVSSAYTLATGAGAGPVTCFGGESEIIDFQGRPLAVASHPGDEVITATLRFEPLRLQREAVGFNFPALSRTQLYALQYGNLIGFPNNSLNNGSKLEAQDVGVATHDVIERYYTSGRWVRPASTASAAD